MGKYLFLEVCFEVRLNPTYLQMNQMAFCTSIVFDNPTDRVDRLEEIGNIVTGIAKQLLSARQILAKEGAAYHTKVTVAFKAGNIEF